MMSLGSYYMWHPCLTAPATATSPATLDVFVTHGLQFHIGEGTDAFVRTLLSDLGLVVGDDPLRWSMARYRSFYFTSYPRGDELWCDRWPSAWRVRVELPRLPAEGALTASLDDGSIATNAFDASWSPFSDPDDVAAAPCLVVADFPDEAAFASAHRAVTRAARLATLSRGLAHGRFPLLHVDLGPRDGGFYEAGAEQAEELMHLCEAEGGATHFAL